MFQRSASREPLHGANHGLGDVAQDRVLVGAAGPGFALPQVHFRTKIELPGNGGTGLLAHEAVERAAEFALIGLGKPPIEHVRHHKAQHPIAEKFKALIVRLPRTAMRQCALIQRDILGWLRK